MGSIAQAARQQKTEQVEKSQYQYIGDAYRIRRLTRALLSTLQ